MRLKLKYFVFVEKCAILTVRTERIPFIIVKPRDTVNVLSTGN